jgi:hypothetical protein
VNAVETLWLDTFVEGKMTTEAFAYLMNGVEEIR